MRILSLTNCPLNPKSGSGKTVLMYTQGLRDRGHTVQVAEPQNYEWGSNLGRAKKFRQAWGAWRYVQQQLASETYDIIEFYGDEFWLVTWQLAQRQQRPLLVAHTNGLELLDFERSPAYKPTSALRTWFNQQTHGKLSHLAFSQADAFVSLCELDRQHVLKLGYYTPDLAQVVEPGLDPEYLEVPWTADKAHRIAFTGSWTPRKGLGQLCRVMTQVMQSDLQVTLHLYGTGAHPDTICENFPTALHDRLIVYPRLANAEMAASLAQAKVFFFPSQYEGFGIALAEAMACGCAAITTPTGFGAELKSGTEAIVCDFSDEPAMIQSLNQLLQDDSYRIQIAQAGWQRVRSLTWDANIDLLDQLYRQWTQARNQR